MLEAQNKVVFRYALHVMIRFRKDDEGSKLPLRWQAACFGERSERNYVLPQGTRWSHAQGLPALLAEDPVAQGPVLEMLLLPHFRQLLELDPALHPPLKLEKCAAISQARIHALLLRSDAHATNVVEAS